MQVKCSPLQFKFVGDLRIQAVAIGNIYSIETQDCEAFTASVLGYSIKPVGDKFEAQVLGASLGGGTIERCALICQQHLESAIAAFIEPVSKVAAE